jgi:hypothetical protein
MKANRRANTTIAFLSRPPGDLHRPGLEPGPSRRTIFDTGGSHEVKRMEKACRGLNTFMGGSEDVDENFCSHSGRLNWPI